jgi:hydrogenase maturation protein HypF
MSPDPTSLQRLQLQISGAVQGVGFRPLGLLYECLGETAFERLDLAPLQSFLPAELSILKTMLQRGLNTPRTSSMGRLFDAIASLLGLCQNISFEGQAAMQLEFAIASLAPKANAGHVTEATYPY